MTDPKTILQRPAGRTRLMRRGEQHPAHILIVDDDPRVRSLERAILLAHGYSSHECASGDEALRILETRRFDAILLDIRMPGIDGWEVLRAIREREYETPVLIVSGDASLLEATERRADAVLRKPFTVMELVGALRAVLRHRGFWPLSGLRSGGAESFEPDPEYLLARAS